MKDVFLCHTGIDKPWVERLAERLEAEAIQGREVSVFLDKWDIDFGENILQRIEEGLQESRYLAVVLSPALTKADWPRLEWQSQVYDDPAGKKARILPIVLHKYDPDTEERLKVPLPLKILKCFDFSSEGPIGAENSARIGGCARAAGLGTYWQDDRSLGLRARPPGS